MKLAAATALALSLTATSLALADSRDDRWDDDSQKRPSHYWSRWHQDRDRDRDSHGRHDRDRHDWDHDWDHRGDHEYRGHYFHGRDDWYRDHRDYRYWRHRDYRDYRYGDYWYYRDYRDYRDRRVHPHYRFRFGEYRRPYGYAYHRWGRGERLPVAYYAPPYVLHRYRDCGLYAPPRGHHWVRVDRDAILAAIATGIVLEAVYDHFY